MERLNLDAQSRVLVLTGAGVSAESGVPTFRGMNGLWEGHRVEEVASPEGFAADPQLVWRFYSLRREGAAQVHPNPGHLALAKLEQQLGERFLLATQNVDGLHARAGSRRLLAIHGELFQSRCERCNVPFADTSTHFAPPLPRCETCQGAVRPHIVWFGETLDPAHLETVGDFIQSAGRHLVFLAVGTSGLVYPAAGLVDAARSVGGSTWLIDASPGRGLRGALRSGGGGKSGEVLPSLCAEDFHSGGGAAALAHRGALLPASISRSSARAGCRRSTRKARRWPSVRATKPSCIQGNWYSGGSSVSRQVLTRERARSRAAARSSSVTSWYSDGLCRRSLAAKAEAPGEEAQRDEEAGDRATHGEGPYHAPLRPSRAPPFAGASGTATRPAPGGHLLAQRLEGRRPRRAPAGSASEAR